MFKVRDKIFVMLFSVIIVPIIIIGVFITWHTTKSIKQDKIAALQQYTKVKVEKAIYSVRSIEEDIRSIAGNVSVLSLTDAISNEDTVQINLWKSNLQLIFQTLAESKRIYDKIQYIDESGVELIRLDLGESDSAETALTKKLRNKRDAYFLKEALKLNEGEIYISELDLNSEYDEIDSIHELSLRYAIPVFDSEKQNRGILVFYVLAYNLFENVLSNSFDNGIDTYFIDKNGFYLHSEMLKRQDGSFKLRSGGNIKGDLPQDATTLVMSGKSGVKLVDNQFLSFRPIKYDALDSGRYWICMECLDKSAVYSSVYIVYKIIGIFVLLLIAGIITATFVFSRKLTKPLNELVKGATAVAKGDLDYHINVKSNDELEFLTFSFNKMTYSLGKTRKQLENYTHNLEQKVAGKTKTLNEKLKKSEVLVEAGQLLWDEEDVNKTMNRIVNLITETLKTKFCMIYLYDKTNNSLCPVSGVGWKEGIVGHTTLNVEPGSYTEFNLSKLKPVVIDDLRNETRFSILPLLAEHGVVSGVSVPMIVGDSVLGVLGVYTEELTSFTKHDTNFLQSVGYIVAAAVEGRRAEKEIENEREYIGNLIETAKDAIVGINEKGTISIWNQSAENIFGYPENEIIGQPVTTIIPEKYRKQHAAGLQKFIKTGEFKNLDKTLDVFGITKEGVEIPIEMSLTAQKIENDRYLFTAIIRDLTERKKMEEVLLQSEKLKSIGTITAGVSHEFNNILAIISGSVQIMEMQYSDNKQLGERLQTVGQAAKDGEKIINRMLKFAKTEKITEELEPVDIRELIEQSIEFSMPRWRNMAQPNGIDYRIDTDAVKEVAAVLCNSTEIREVFINIINNALDAMPDGGRISFSTWNTPDKVYVAVSDTGCGMPEDIMKYIFDPFFTTKLAVGTGLGMSVAYGILSRHSGKINVESEVGKGSTFTLELPATGDLVIPITSTSNEQDAKCKDLSILVVDDEVNICELLNVYLSNDGHNVKTVDNGADAINITMRERFDLVLCDMAMPQVSGYDVVKALNMLDKIPKIGIITGWDGKPVPIEDKDINIDFILKKPFDFKVLMKHINALFISG
ncbi:MAG: PAS domain S-box protein [Candidatus Scalindua sp.]|nr:PAS domain S-box protein [Candidatus Scalindua sp.]